MKNYKIIGKMEYHPDIKIVEIDGTMYALSGWNGEQYNHCWECDKYGNALNDKEFIIKENLVEVGDDEFEVESYEVH